MSQIKLTDAIEANKNGLGRLEIERNDLRKRAGELNQKANLIHDEIVARREMALAMEKLQKLMPADETIMFLVPEDE